MEYLNTAVLGSVVGVVGTGLGGLICYLFNPTKKVLSAMMAFCAGVMVGVVCFSMLGECFDGIGVIEGFICVFMGASFVFLVERRFRGVNLGTTPSALKTTGLLVGMSIALHNLPEGIALGSGYIHGTEVSLSLALVLLLHNIPEGVAMGAPLRASGMKKGVILATIAAGLPTAIGAIIGYAAGNISASFYGGCMGFASGAMLYISCVELIGKSMEIEGGVHAPLCAMAGMVMGWLIIMYI